VEYKKPEIILIDSASAAIQAMPKPFGIKDNYVPHDLRPSVSAYESDE
jgi:hypothetical protein